MKRSAISRYELGLLGETDACRYWLAKYPRAQLLAKNFRVKTGEIDLIFQDQDTLVFVEVRTRASTFPVEPIDSITKTKIARMTRAIQAYLLVYKGRAKNLRIDYLFKTREANWIHLQG